MAGQPSLMKEERLSSVLPRVIDRHDLKSTAFYFGPLPPPQPPPSDTYLKPENHPTATVRILSMLQKQARFPSFDRPMIYSVLDYVGKLLESPYFQDSLLSKPIPMDVSGMSCSQIVSMLMQTIVDYVAPFPLSHKDKSDISTRIQGVGSSSSSTSSMDTTALCLADVIGCDENKRVVSFLFFFETVVQYVPSGKTSISQATIYVHLSRFPLNREAVIRDAEQLTVLEQLSVDDYVHTHNSIPV